MQHTIASAGTVYARILDHASTKLTKKRRCRSVFAYAQNSDLLRTTVCAGRPGSRFDSDRRADGIQLHDSRKVRQTRQVLFGLRTPVKNLTQKSRRSNGRMR